MPADKDPLTVEERAREALDGAFNATSALAALAVAGLRVVEARDNRDETGSTVERCRHCGASWICPDCDGKGDISIAPVAAVQAVDASPVHWPDCAMNHGGSECDMGPDCGGPGVLKDIDDLIEYVEQDVGVIYSGPDVPELTGKAETIESLREIRAAVRALAIGEQGFSSAGVPPSEPGASKGKP